MSKGSETKEPSGLYAVGAVYVDSEKMPNRANRKRMTQVGQYDMRDITGDTSTKGVIVQAFFDAQNNMLVFRMPNDTGFILRVDMIANQLFQHWQGLQPGEPTPQEEPTPEES